MEKELSIEKLTVSIIPSDAYAIGIDIGGTKIHLAAVNKNGDILQELKIPTHVNSGAQAINKDIIQAIQKLIFNMKYAPIGIGIGVAGQIEAKTGLVRFAPNLFWNDIPLKEIIEDTLRVPVKITNDVRAGAIAEWLFGSGKGCNDFICLFIGTGIGGGIVSGGKLITGANNSAGEIGHIAVDLNGCPCSCGSNGCMETYASGWAIAENAKKEILRNSTLKHSLGSVEAITAKKVIAAYRADDELALKIINQAKDALIAGCASIVNAFNPKKLIISGGVFEGLPEILEWLQEGIPKRAFPATTQGLEILPAKLQHGAGVIGAAMLIHADEL